MENDQWPDDFCGFINTELPIATGTANINYTDNDVYAWAQDNSNANSLVIKQMELLDQWASVQDKFLNQNK